MSKGTEDIGQKMNLLRMFWSWGYFPQIEIRLTHPEAAHKTRMELTDLDVLGIRLTHDLTVDMILGDCTTKDISAINRTYTIKGVMDYLNIPKAYIILKKDIPEDHKVAAYSMGITILNEDEYRIFSQKLINDDASATLKMFDYGSWKYFEGNISNLKFFLKALNYRKFRYWADPPSRALRYTLMELREIRDKIDFKNKFHKALVLEFISLFSISYIRMLGSLFHLYLISDNKETIDSYLKAFIYGGREIYDNQNKLLKIIHTLKKGSQEQLPFSQELDIPDLSLPEWNLFLQIFRTFLESPKNVVEIPRLLRFTLFERILFDNKIKVYDAIDTINNHTITFAMRMIEYYCKAAKLKQAFFDDYESILKKELLTINEKTRPS